MDNLRQTQADSLLAAAMTSPSPISIPAYTPPPTSVTPGACALAPKVMPQQRPIALGDHGGQGQVGAGIMTQKEWVIPPRPKVRVIVYSAGVDAEAGVLSSEKVLIYCVLAREEASYRYSTYEAESAE